MRLLVLATFLTAALFGAQWPAPSGAPATVKATVVSAPVRADLLAREHAEAEPTWTLTTPRPSVALAESVDEAARTAIPELIAAAAAEFGTDAARLERVGMCESTLDPLAVGDAQEIGVFQWLPLTWEWLARKSGLGYSIRDIADPAAQTRLTAWAFANGYAHLWTCARKGT